MMSPFELTGEVSCDWAIFYDQKNWFSGKCFLCACLTW